MGLRCTRTAWRSPPCRLSRYSHTEHRKQRTHAEWACSRQGRESRTPLCTVRTHIQQHFLVGGSLTRELARLPGPRSALTTAFAMFPQGRGSEEGVVLGLGRACGPTNHTPCSGRRGATEATWLVHVHGHRRQSQDSGKGFLTGLPSLATFEYADADGVAPWLSQFPGAGVQGRSQGFWFSPSLLLPRMDGSGPWRVSERLGSRGPACGPRS